MAPALMPKTGKLLWNSSCHFLCISLASSTAGLLFQPPRCWNTKFINGLNVSKLVNENLMVVTPGQWKKECSLTVCSWQVCSGTKILRVKNNTQIIAAINVKFHGANLVANALLRLQGCGKWIIGLARHDRTVLPVHKLDIYRDGHRLQN